MAAVRGAPPPQPSSLVKGEVKYKLWGYWGYLGATCANEQVIGLHALGLLGYIGVAIANEQAIGRHVWGPTGAILGLHLPTNEPLESKL